jgi:hypothetical protein
LKVCFSFLVALRSHEEDYPTPKITKSWWWVSCGWLEIGHRISGRKSISGNNYLGGHCKHLDTLTSLSCNNFGRHYIGEKVCRKFRCVKESKWKVLWVIRIKNHYPWVGIYCHCLHKIVHSSQGMLVKYYFR